MEHLFGQSLLQAKIEIQQYKLSLLKEELDENKLIERIKKFTFPITNACNINFECKKVMEGREETLSKIERRNLLLMSKEIINNSIKYASCKSIDMLFYTRNN